jgi:hypothetical protein
VTPIFQSVMLSLGDVPPISMTRALPFSFW